MRLIFFFFLFIIRFRQVIALGNKLLKSNPELQEVKETIERLKAEEAAIARGWKEKELWLQQCLQLQMFNKEADNIDAVTSAHQAFLEFSDLGVSLTEAVCVETFSITFVNFYFQSSLDEVEALQKQHRSFANTLSAQDDRLTAFSKKADALIAERHYDSQG